MKREPHWSNLEEKTCLFGIRLLYLCHRYFGRWFFRLNLWPVVCFYWLSSHRARRASLDYLTKLEQHSGALGRPPRLLDSLRHIALFSETLLDKLLAISGNYPAEKVECRGNQAIYQRLKNGQGGVMVTAHTGCLELCQVLGEQLPGVQVNILVHTHHASQFNRLLAQLNPRSRVQLIEVQTIHPNTALMLAQRVAAGELVAIAGDRTPVSGGRTIALEFLGHLAPFPIGPYVLAHLLQCPLYGLICTHQASGYLLSFETLAEQVHLPRAEREQHLAQYATRYVEMLSRQLAQSPYDWFNFFPFWDQQQ